MTTNQSVYSATTSSWVNSTDVMTSIAKDNGSVDTGINRLGSRSHHTYMQLLDSFTFAIGSVGLTDFSICLVDYPADQMS